MTLNASSKSSPSDAGMPTILSRWRTLSAQLKTSYDF